MSTFWTNPTPYAYMQQQDQWMQFVSACFRIIQLFGTIAFIRGLVILSHAGDRGHGQNTVGKGMTHIIGGILCINIYGLINVIIATFGLGVTLA